MARCKMLFCNEQILSGDVQLYSYISCSTLLCIYKINWVSVKFLNGLCLNTRKFIALRINKVDSTAQIKPLQFNNTTNATVHTVKHLGVIFNNSFNIYKPCKCFMWHNANRNILLCLIFVCCSPKPTSGYK